MALLRMTRAALGLAVLAASGVALAAPTRLVTEPPGWRADPEQATALAQRFAATRHLGGLTAETAAVAFVADRPGGALFVTRATAALPGAADAQGGPATAALAARAALEELRATAQRAALTGGAAEERDWQERVDPEAREVTATLRWQDPETHAASIARIVIASDGARIAQVTGECFAGEGAEPAQVAACEGALGSLDPGIPAARRVALTLAPAPAAGATAEPALPPSSAREPSRLSDGADLRLPPMAIPQDRPPADRRPLFVGLGVMILALALWWSRQQRDRFDREDEAPRARRRPRPRPHPMRTDEDADDLHAAARGEEPKP